MCCGMVTPDQNPDGGLSFDKRSDGEVGDRTLDLPQIPDTIMVQSGRSTTELHPLIRGFERLHNHILACLLLRTEK